MAEAIKLVDPQRIRRNPENPRLIFRQDELDDLQSNIARQGILVPLTVFRDGNQYYLLDGERRWICAIKLGLPRVPVIVHPKPDRMQNIMLMFSIHKTRKDWDPLPTALKLAELERVYAKRHSRQPTEAELAGLASLSRGEVRRLKKLLGLPEDYKAELLRELEKPRAKQEITVDHVLEATKAVESLRKREVIDAQAEEELRRAILTKFRRKVVINTVAPRKLARLARAVERKEVPVKTAQQVIQKLISIPDYSIDDAFRQSVEQADFEYNIRNLAERMTARLEEHQGRGYRFSESLGKALRQLAGRINSLLRE